MAYFPQFAGESPNRYAEGRPSNASLQPRRAPNDFRDYNHGPDSRGPHWFRSTPERAETTRKPHQPLAAGYGYADAASEYLQDHAGYNGAEYRGYDQSALRGGLGNSGSRDDFADRRFDQDRNPFRGGYGGGDYDHDRRDEPLLGHIGMNSHGPADQPPREAAPERRSSKRPEESRQDYGRGWNDMDDHHDRGRQR